MVDSNSRQDNNPIKRNNPIEKSSMGSSQQMQVFEDELKDIYWAENAFVKALPLMIENAPSSKLIDDLTSHLAETKIQVARLEDVFLSFGKKSAAKKCKAIAILIKESESIIKESEQGLGKVELDSDRNKNPENYEFDQFDTLSQFMGTRVFMKEENSKNDEESDKAF